MGKRGLVEIESLSLDHRKWRFFLEIGYRQLPDGYTRETIWDYRLWEAREHFKHYKYDERFPPDKFPRMLMLGAGTGAEVKAAQEYGYEAVGIGLLGKEQLEYARSQGVDMRLMDMHDLKFPNESFDVVWCDNSWEHCVHPWLLCTEVWAVLRSYGRWWINLPTWQNSDKDGPSNQHFMILPPWFMKPMLRRSGFRTLYFEDNEVRYQYLLERLPLEEVGHRNKSIIDSLQKRLKIGMGYDTCG